MTKLHRMSLWFVQSAVLKFAFLLLFFFEVYLISVFSIILRGPSRHVLDCVLTLEKWHHIGMPAHCL